MTRLSGYVLPTEKQPPADAEALSHKLMVRAGLIRQLGAGLWTWMPAGWRVHQHVVRIIREEMNAIGGHELLMPVLHPAELWQRSGRYDIPELMKLQDRKGAEMVLAMTHEENITFHMASIVRSYRDLPRILYHFQTKERDEQRPRAAVLRTREFIMKDAYTFDRDAEGLDVGYQKHIEAYDRIFDRVGLDWYRVESDVGMMGGAGAHEYMAPCAAGEDEVALAPGYAANVEIASAEAQPVELPEPLPEPVLEETPGHGHRRRRGGRAGRADRRAAEGLSGDRRRRRPAPGDAARRPPRQRDQAAQRARRGRPPRAPGRVRGAHRAGRLHRAGGHERPDPARPRRGLGGRPTSRARTGRTRICAASSRAATSRSSRSTSARSRPATSSAAIRSGSSR